MLKKYFGGCTGASSMPFELEDGGVYAAKKFSFLSPTKPTSKGDRKWPFIAH